MREIVLEALVETAKMIPFLLVIYCLVEWVERKFGHSIQETIRHAVKAGPLAGAVFGCVPQCGFSVLASAMYTRRLITIGTLLAVFLSTSDEAVPVILAQPDKANLILPLLLTKLLVGVVCGYGVDLALRSYIKPQVQEHRDDEDDIHEKGCCEHEIAQEDSKWKMITHPLIHTAKVFLFLFLVSAGLNYLMWIAGEHNLAKILMHNSPIQPVITAIVGLIPNCAASVAITQVYLNGGISFGATISGLCASGGLGILVLLKDNGNAKDTAKVLGLLLGISIAVGIVIQYTIG